MLNNNLRNLRKYKGISQEELAVKLNVVRQTISKWEKGLSVPDSEMLMHIAEALDTSVDVLLGADVPIDDENEFKAIAAKLELVNEQLAKQSETRRKIWRTVFIVVGAVAVGLLLLELVLFIRGQWLFSEISENVSIIGGYDGPTNIYIFGTGTNPTLFITIIVATLVSIVGLFATKRR